MNVEMLAPSNRELRGASGANSRTSVFTAKLSASVDHKIG